MHYKALLQPCALIFVNVLGLKIRWQAFQSVAPVRTQYTRLPIPGVVHACKGEPQAPKLAARRPKSEIWLGQIQVVKTCDCSMLCNQCLPESVGVPCAQHCRPISPDTELDPLDPPSH